MSHRDVLAEIELTMVPSLQKHPDPDLYAPPSEARSGTRRRQFWCSLRDQDVEVDFETRALLGLPRTVGVKRCSAFEDPDKVACGRHCPVRR